MNEEEKADVLMRAIGSLEESSEELEEVAEECEEQEEAAIGFLRWLGLILSKIIG